MINAHESYLGINPNHRSKLPQKTFRIIHQSLKYAFHIGKMNYSTMRNTTFLERPHTTRFPSYDGSDCMQYVTTGHRR